MRSSKNTVRIFEDVPEANLRQLAAQVCLTALQDVKQARDPLKALDAFMFLTSPDAAQWLEWGGLPYADPWQLLTSGQLIKKRICRKGKVKSEQRHFAAVGGIDPHGITGISTADRARIGANTR